jgi:phenylacetate-coenzyme A ligase PaaK-like adenylate-forming protein
MIQSVLAGWFLRRNHTQKEIEKSSRKAISAYRRISKSVPWYSNICSLSIQSTEDFKRDVPLLTKSLVFGGISFQSLINDQFHRLGTVLMSSGASGQFSLGVMSKKEMKKAAMETDVFLSLFFNASKGKTFLINASAMGVRAFTGHLCSDTGPRADIVIGLLKNVAIHFEKVFIIGDPIFIKLMVEESLDSGLDWSSMNVFFISGGEWLSETLRSYVHHLTKKDPRKPENGYWSCIYGLTELGYPIFFETAGLVASRSDLSCDQSGKKSTFKSQTRCTTPVLFHYCCSSYFVEEIEHENGNSHLVFTTLDKRKMIPLIRYDTGDVGELLDVGFLPDYQFNLPLLAFWGRDFNYLDLGCCKVYLTDVKKLLFGEIDLLPLITGFFTLLRKEEKACLSVQLKDGALVNDELKEKFLQTLHQTYPNCIDLEFSNYHGMNQQMELDFERKFNHLNAKNHE